MSKITYSNIAKFVRHHRDKKGLSQRELSEKLGYKNPQYVSNIERGMCPLPREQGPIICEAFEVTKYELLNALYADLRDNVYAYFPSDVAIEDPR